MSTLRLTTISNQSGSASVPSDTVINGSAKAWVNFKGTGTVTIRAGFNVSSITDLGTGAYMVNLTNAFSDTNYAPVLGHGYADDTTGYTFGVVLPNSTSQIRVNIAQDSFGERDTSWIQVAVFR